MEVTAQDLCRSLAKLTEVLRGMAKGRRGELGVEEMANKEVGGGGRERTERKRKIMETRLMRAPIGKGGESGAMCPAPSIVSHADEIRLSVGP